MEKSFIFPRENYKNDRILFVRYRDMLEEREVVSFKKTKRQKVPDTKNISQRPP